VFGFWIQSEDVDHLGRQHEDLTDSWGYMTEAFGIPVWVRGSTYMRRARTDPLPDLPVVMITSQVAQIPGTVSLADFTHPDECLYWFGGSNENIREEPPNVIAKVYIPVDEMHSPQAGAIVAWDRLIRHGQSDN